MITWYLTYLFLPDFNQLIVSKDHEGNLGLGYFIDSSTYINIDPEIIQGYISLWTPILFDTNLDMFYNDGSPVDVEIFDPIDLYCEFNENGDKK